VLVKREARGEEGCSRALRVVGWLSYIEKFDLVTDGKVRRPQVPGMASAARYHVTVEARNPVTAIR
jgi:hypothetical protein